MNELDKKKLESAKIIRGDKGHCGSVACDNCFAYKSEYEEFCEGLCFGESIKQTTGAIAYIAEHEPEEVPVVAKPITPLDALPALSEANIAIDEKIVEMVETEQSLTDEAVNEYNFFSYLLRRRAEVSA